jgi:hypothetical protein
MRAHPLIMLAAVAICAVAGAVATGTLSSAQEGVAVELFEGAAGTGKGLAEHPSIAARLSKKLHAIIENEKPLVGPVEVPGTTPAASALDAHEEATVAAAVLSPAVVDGMISDLRTQPIISADQAEKVIAKWIVDSAQQAASKPNSGVTFEALSGDLTVDASVNVIPGFKIKGGKINIYKFAREVVKYCGIADVALLLQTRELQEVCLENLFKGAETAWKKS